MALIDEIATMAEIDQEKHKSYLSIMVPILIEFAEDECGTSFNVLQLPAGVKLFIADSIKYKLKSKGLSSRSMGSVSYSYDTKLPEKVKDHLSPYRKLVF
ncbi:MULTISPECIES: phage head-tail connector protein [unclassified Oceanobacillus]|uniref:phage head-tail connector protein n=1 Tax=unclassified Oceanobacillus TaxID=2630292 RepID=UPI001BE6B7BD|nr:MULTISPECIES: phage head-tail connector protein [unclassified Oceanobacillus]MBT2599089.1 phage head-tail connector protein [Oceanobacillus sp. ISL-74]MBT2652007.1 phage head-tail connector protein [Oceanobacillus sp. ISL-73]